MKIFLCTVLLFLLAACGSVYHPEEKVYIVVKDNGERITVNAYDFDVHGNGTDVIFRGIRGEKVAEIVDAVEVRQGF